MIKAAFASVCCLTQIGDAHGLIATRIQHCIRGSAIREQSNADSAGLLKTFDLTNEEIQAIKVPDLGLFTSWGLTVKFS